MKNSHPQSVFYWQALLIAAPVVILSVIALYSLRQDKASILQNARSDAGSIAPVLAENCAEAIAKGWVDSRVAQNSNLLKPEKEQAKCEILEGIVAGGAILVPIDYAPLPVPSTWVQAMLPHQRQLLFASEEALFQKKNSASGLTMLAALKASGSREASANAELNLLLIEAARNGTPDIARRLTSLARRYRKVETPAGTPVADIALLRALRCADQQLLTEVLLEVTGRMKNYPSFLTADLVAAVEQAQAGQYFLKNEWRIEEETRNLMRTFLHQFGKSALEGEFWFQDGDQVYLVLCSPSVGTHVAVITARWLESILVVALGNGGSHIPSYAGVELQIGSRRWEVDLGRTPISEPRSNDLLASASGKIHVRSRLDVPVVAFKENMSKFAPAAIIEGWPSDGDINRQLPLSASIDHPFTVNLVLTDADLLYARYRQRLWLMAGFVLLATVAAGLGLAGTWRAFQRQVRLAEMTSNFVSSVSHELRAPLASLLLMAESLDQGRVVESEKQKGYFHLIVQECRRLSSLVENVLDFSRIRQGRKSYEFETVNASALVRQTLQLMMPIAEERQVHLEITESQLPNQKLEPCWDGQAVQQALINLIDNAIKHSPPDATVKVECTASENQICIFVSDRGEGIPEKEQERIFEPFYRRGSELRRETKGIGIGLSIVKHAADAHGGSVIVESKPGQGSRFKLELPLGNSG